MRLRGRTLWTLMVVAAAGASVACSDELSEAPGVIVSGTITTPAGAPLEGAALTLEVYVRPAACGGTPNDVQTSVSDVNGEYTMQGFGSEGLPAQNACVQVTAEPPAGSGFATTAGLALAATLRTPPNTPEITSDIVLQAAP